MVDLFGIRHLYALAVFRYDRGSTTYNGATIGTNTPVIKTNGLERTKPPSNLARAWCLASACC